jgi:hypothetical protein
LAPYAGYCALTGLGVVVLARFWDWFLGFGFGFFWVFEVIKKCRNVR